MTRLQATVRFARLAVPAVFTAAVLSAQPTGEAQRIVEVLELGSGMVAADVGAGEGRFTSVLARGVGPEGRVCATEIDERKLDEVNARMAADGIRNVATVLGDQNDTGLPADCCDRILLRLVYHHFADPKAMRASLWSALAPGGRIAVIDVPPKKDWPRLPDAVDRGGHGIEPADLLSEMTAYGFEVVSQHQDWPAETDSYCVVFRRPTG